MRRWTSVLLMLCSVAAWLPQATAQPIPAFPGAEGAGALATGGRPIEKLNYKTGLATPTLEKRGTVYHVTTLDPDPAGTIPGSLMYGLKNENFWYSTHPTAPMNIDQPDTFDVTPRIIVFDVGGTIDFSNLPANQRDIDITPMNFTIAGQTAPGGITILGAEFNPGHRELWDGPLRYPPKTNNLVLRNFAVRTNNPSEKDGLWLATTNSIADHLSLAWYTDEGVSITDSARNVTVQHSIVGPGWNNPDGDGSQIEGKTPMADISVHHNLYIHNDARIIRVGEKAATGAPGVELDFRNNVIYNWNDNSAGYSVPGEPSFTNFVNNYYIGGPGNSAGDDIFEGGDTITRIYQHGNLLDLDRDGTPDGADVGASRFDGSYTEVFTPYSVPHGVTQNAAEALDTVRNYAGARWWDRDFLDQRSLAQLATFGQGTVAQTGQVLSALDPADVAAVANAPLQTRPAGWDTDDDGMPDHWELAHGLNPNSPLNDTDWNLDYDNDGYINVEEYVNEIAAWPAPDQIVFSGAANNRFAQITNWGITRTAPGEAPTTTHWQPSRFDVAVIPAGAAVVDAVGQHAGTILIAHETGQIAHLQITGGALDVEQSIMIGTNSSNATLSLSGGRLSVTTLVKGSGGGFGFTGGTLHAETVDFDLVNHGGSIAPGGAAGEDRIGMTHIAGDLTLQEGVLEIEVGGTAPGQADFIIVDGVTILGGTLRVVPVDLGGGMYVPQLGDIVPVLASQLGTGGMFDAFDLPALAPGLIWQLMPGAVTNYLQVVTGDPLFGDYNNDGSVDAADYTTWRDALEHGGPLANETATPGVVDEADYVVWKDHFGQLAGAGASAAVPEPAVLWTIIGIVPWLLVRMPSDRRPVESL